MWPRTFPTRNLAQGRPAWFSTGFDAMESAVEEGDAPISAGNAQTTAVKVATLWLRIDGLLDRSVMAARHLAALITRMENRVPRGPSDYADVPRGIYVNYGASGGPSPNREPSWQGYLAKIVAVLIASGIGGLIWILSAMNSRLSTIEANQTGGQRYIIQRLDEQEKHLEAHDKQLDEVNRELWPHKH